MPRPSKEQHQQQQPRTSVSSESNWIQQVREKSDMCSDEAGMYGKGAGASAGAAAAAAAQEASNCRPTTPPTATGPALLPTSPPDSEKKRHGAHFSTEIALEDAIGSHACSLQDASCVWPNGIPLGHQPPLTGTTVNPCPNTEGVGAGPVPHGSILKLTQEQRNRRV
jgi:hypothetical protein